MGNISNSKVLSLLSSKRLIVMFECYLSYCYGRANDFLFYWSVKLYYSVYVKKPPLFGNG